MITTTIGPQAPIREALPADVDAEMDAIWTRCRDELAIHEELRHSPPLIRLWDGDFAAAGSVADEIESSWPWVYNDIGEGVLAMNPEHHLAQWVLAYWERDARNVFVTVDTATGARWSGILDEYELKTEKDGTKTLELHFLEDTVQLADILCWPNPFMPAAGPQWPKYFTLAGPARWTLKLLLLVNLLRYSENLWVLPDDPLDPTTWVEGITPWTWPIVVKPGSLLLDDSQWVIFDARMDPWLDVAEEPLADAGLMIETRRWLDGDPPPWPGAIMTHGQLVIDLVDKSGVFEGTATGGTILGGLTRTITSHADNFIDEIVNIATDLPEPAEYSVSRWLGTSPAQPWVIYEDGPESGIEVNYHRKQEGPPQITAGGKSAPGVNEAQSLAIQLTGNIIGSIFRLDTLGTIIDQAAAPHYEDVWAAWMTHKSPLRTMRQGRFYRHERFVDGADQSYTLSGILALRRGFWDTRAQETVEIDLGAGGPYLLGPQGHGHAWLGDRIGSTVQHLQRGRVIVEQIHVLTLGTGRDGVGWAAVCGDPRPLESPWDRGLRRIRRFTRTLRRHNVL